MAYEDFTGFTEFDEGNDVTVDSATKVSWVNLESWGDTAYLYKDKGVNHFSGDFIHKFEMQFSNIATSFHVTHLGLANIIGDRNDVMSASGDMQGISVYYHTDAGFSFKVEAIQNGAGNSDAWTGCSEGVTYFVELVRDDDGGANNTGRLTAYIRTGSHSGALQDTLVVDCAVGEQNDFRYIYALMTHDDGGSNIYQVDGFTQNLDIGEAPAGWTGKMSGVTNPAKINGVAVANITSVMGV